MTTKVDLKSSDILKHQLKALEREYHDKKMELEGLIVSAERTERQKADELQEYLNEQYFKYTWLNNADGVVTHYAKISEEPVKVILAVKHPESLNGLKLNKVPDFKNMPSTLIYYATERNTVAFIEFETVGNFEQFVKEYNIQLNDEFIKAVGDVDRKN